MNVLIKNNFQLQESNPNPEEIKKKNILHCFRWHFIEIIKRNERDSQTGPFESGTSCNTPKSSRDPLLVQQFSNYIL